MKSIVDDDWKSGSAKLWNSGYDEIMRILIHTWQFHLMSSLCYGTGVDRANMTGHLRRDPSVNCDNSLLNPLENGDWLY